MALSAMKSAVPPLNPCVDQQRSHLSFAGDELSFMIIPIPLKEMLPLAGGIRAGRPLDLDAVRRTATYSRTGNT